MLGELAFAFCGVPMILLVLAGAILQAKDEARLWWQERREREQ